MVGYLYVLSNAFLKKDGRPIYKVGFTNNLPRRLGTLNTSVPENFKVEALFESKEYKKLELLVKEFIGGSMKTMDGDTTEFIDKPLCIVKRHR